MIQRIQSLWLLCAALILLFTLFIPYAMQSSSTTDTDIVTQVSINNRSQLWLTIATTLGAFASLFTIFMFKNRPLQMKLTLLCILLTLLTGTGMLYTTFQQDLNFTLAVGLVGNKLYIGILLPLLSSLLLLMAYRAIRADEKLIKSVDRLR